MKVFRIQDTNNQVGKAGAVAPGIAVDYPGEAEMITLGFAPGKAYDSVGIGRHGNFMLWGWSASPSKMTPAGQKLFLNCICYIHQYDRKPFTRIQRRAMARETVFMLFDRMKQSPANAQTYLSRFFPADLVKRYGQDLTGMRTYFNANRELIYMDQYRFCVDEDLKSLDIDSNCNVATVKALVDMLGDSSTAERAHTCLRRYTGQSFKTAQEWRQWYAEHAQRLFFSDTGGYRFYDTPSP